MDIQNLLEIGINIVFYGLGAYVFVTFVLFVMRDLAPRLMTGKVNSKEFVSLIAGGLFVLFLLAFAPHYIGKAILYGWESFKPIVVEITSDIATDVMTITSGNEVVISLPETPAEMPTPIIQQETPVPQVPTPTLAPTSTPFDLEGWTPDQPVPTPGN